MKEPVHTNALSRVADVYVCDDCGTAEAMLAFMKQQYPLTCWAAFQPQRPPADFKARPAHEVMGIVLRTQSEDLQRIFLLCRDDPENAEWHRLEAFESCPGLTELWPQPFQAKFRAADGAVFLRGIGHRQPSVSFIFCFSHSSLSCADFLRKSPPVQHTGAHISISRS